MLSHGWGFRVERIFFLCPWCTTILARRTLFSLSPFGRMTNESQLCGKGTQVNPYHRGQIDLSCSDHAHSAKDVKSQHTNRSGARLALAFQQLQRGTRIPHAAPSSQRPTARHFTSLAARRAQHEAAVTRPSRGHHEAAVTSLHARADSATSTCDAPGL